tara:strand:+ start:596 stop:1300 length:705 start_codon:yes stop_codon:yes gene_type:complete
MNNKINILIAILFTLTYSNNLIDKKLNYDIEYKNIYAGEAFLLINEDSLYNTKVLKLKSNLRTNKFVDFFYKIRDEIIIYMDYDDLSLLKVINKISEGKYKKNHNAILDKESRSIISKNKKTIIKNKVYAPLSIIYSLRKKLLHIDDIYKYEIYNMNKLKNINMNVIGREKVNTPFGKYNTIVLSPKSDENESVIKNNGDMKIWFTDDKNRYPIKIEIKLNHGSILLLLNNIEQ